MQLGDYLRILWRRKWVIFLTATVTVVVVLVGTVLATPTFAATVKLRVATAPGGTVASADYMYADRLMNTYTQIATSGPVLEALAQRLGLDEPPTVEAKIVASTELIEITVESPSPGLARDAANSLAEILIAQGSNLYSGTGKAAHEILAEQLAQLEQELRDARQALQGLVSRDPQDADAVNAANRSIELKEQTYATMLAQYEQARLRESLLAGALSVVEPAVAPIAPAKPRKVLNLGLGSMVGLVGGVGLAFLFENLDSTLYMTAQIEQVTEAPILARVPAVTGRRQSAFFDRDSPQTDALQRLQARLSALGDDQPLQTLLVTSAQPREGKSTVAANLALTLAQSGRRVIVVDADLRRPTLHRFFRMSNALGLSSFLTGPVKPAEAVQDQEPPVDLPPAGADGNWSRIWRSLDWFDVLPSGPPLPNPVETLGSSRMAALIKQLRLQYEIVLFDTPALMAATDAAVLTPAMDGVILIVGRARARRDAVRAACKQLADVKANFIGVVETWADTSQAAYHYYRRTPDRNNGRNHTSQIRTQKA